MGTIIGKFHQNPLKIGGVAETDGTDEPIRQTSGDNK